MDHLQTSIDRFVDLSELRRDLAPFYSSMGRPSVDPELMIRMLIIGYCFGIRSKRLREEVRPNPTISLIGTNNPTTDRVPDYEKQSTAVRPALFAARR